MRLFFVSCTHCIFPVVGTIGVFLNHVKHTSSLTSVNVHFRMHSRRQIRFASFAKLDLKVALVNGKLVVIPL